MLYRWEQCDLAGPMAPGFEDRLVAQDYRDRPAPPADVFCYPLVDTWKDRVWAMVADVVTEQVKLAFIENPPEYVVSDDLSWLNDLVLEVTDQFVDMKSLVADRLRTTFRAFRAGHATRTDDLRPFYTEGLRYLRADEVEQRARDLFLTDRYRWGTEERLQAAIEELHARDERGGREGRLYFCANEPELFTRAGGSGHYLVFGSEYLYCLGMRIVGTGNTQAALKSIGRPTMLVCDIPIRDLHSYTLEEFAGLIFEYLFSSLVPGMECHALSPRAGSALSVSTDINPEHIVGHYHPSEIHSPL